MTEAHVIAVARGITINGLPIVNDRMNRFGPRMKDLDLYYRNCVIGGTGVFLVVAKDFQSFARAVRRKLVLEIAGLMPPRPLFQRAAGPVPPPCNAAEQNLRLRQMNQF